MKFRSFFACRFMLAGFFVYESINHYACGASFFCAFPLYGASFLSF